MNKTKTLAAIVMFAAVIGMVSFGSAFGAKADKVTVCHYQEFVEEDLLADPPVIGQAEAWIVINISGNAQNAHVGIHGDGEVSDFLIVSDDDDDELNVVNDSVANCETLNDALTE